MLESDITGETEITKIMLESEITQIMLEDRDNWRDRDNPDYVRIQR